jgi:hypothetical protein
MSGASSGMGCPLVATMICRPRVERRTSCVWISWIQICSYAAISRSVSASPVGAGDRPIPAQSRGGQHRRSVSNGARRSCVRRSRARPTGGVIPAHTAEVSTTNGKVNPGTRLAHFIELIDDRPVYVPLSGATMAFDGSANCVAGCGGATMSAPRPRSACSSTPASPRECSSSRPSH